jgi:hypothetical protein
MIAIHFFSERARLEGARIALLFSYARLWFRAFDHVVKPDEIRFRETPKFLGVAVNSCSVPRGAP